MNNEILIRVSRLVMIAGLNTAHDYDGINSYEDLILYLDAVIEHNEKLNSKLRSLEMKEELYNRLRGQISIYAGKVDGGLANLQDMYHKINNNEDIICESCKCKISKSGHHLAECRIVNNYLNII